MKTQVLTDGGLLIYDEEIKKYVEEHIGTTVEASSINGNIKINGNETSVYTHPNHVISDIQGLQNALDSKSPTSHTHDDYLSLISGGKIGTDDASINIDGTGIHGDTNSYLNGFYSISSSTVETDCLRINAKDITGIFAEKEHEHTKSDITDFPTSMPASDVYSWAKASTKPTYTASEVGLGNVPNVATNDQAPTYTVASSNTALVSGEKLSTAFGKIAKAVSSLISHLSNKSNPHGVTASQIGAINKGGDTVTGTLEGENGDGDTTWWINELGEAGDFSYIASQTFKEGGVNLSDKYAAKSHTHTTSDITNISSLQSKTWNKIGEVTGTTAVSIPTSYNEVYAEIWVDGQLYNGLNMFFITAMSGARNIRLTGLDCIAITEVHNTYIKLTYAKLSDATNECTSTSKMFVYAR